MEVAEAIRGRRSIRAYASDDVPEAKVEELVKLAAMAPSAGNLQSRDFVVVRDEDTKRSLARAALDQDFVSDAPVVVVVCANMDRVDRYGERGRTLYAIQDAAAATQNLLLAAHDMGLGAAWVGAFREGDVSGILGLPPHARPTAIVPIGWPREDPAPPERLSLSDVLHEERW